MVQNGHMPERMSFGVPQLSTSGARPAAQRTDESPFRILVLGDFSGRMSRGAVEPLRGRKVRLIDLDRFDTVLAAMAPRLELELPRGEKISLSFRQLDDFHPDRLWEQNEFFAPHRQMRSELKDPATFAAAMAAAAASPAEPAAKPASGEAEDIWSKLTGMPAAKPAAAPAPVSAVEALVKNAVAGHLVAGPDPRQAEMVAAFDNALSGQMRALLHHPHFQGLEAAWRGVDFLLRNLDTDETLEVALLDVSRAELAADLRATNSVSALSEILLDQPAGTRPWTVIAGLLTFSPDSEDDADLLARLAHITAAGRLPFIAGAGAPFLAKAQARADEADVPAAWQTLRALPSARHAGLAGPRFLLRLPYGKHSDAIDHFAFEETPAKPNSDALLWGNPALIAALILATAWREEGWGFTAPVNAAVSGLPVHVFTEDGEKKVTPCGEIILTDRTAENLQALGVMPLATVRDRDSVRLLRFQSIAQPPAGLAGL